LTRFVVKNKMPRNKNFQLSNNAANENYKKEITEKKTQIELLKKILQKRDY